jgi:methylated-DNA-[protein]-cysteine S-methyltransferase
MIWQHGLSLSPQPSLCLAVFGHGDDLLHKVRNPLASYSVLAQITVPPRVPQKGTTMLNFFTDLIDSPLGEMMIVTDEHGALRALEWTDLSDRMTRLLDRQYRGIDVRLQQAKAPDEIKKALTAYFGGQLAALDNLVTVGGGTEFQRSVWKALRTIPVGETRSYRDIAIAIGNPKGVRAIGLANGANPIGIVVPCHRVIGANGTLTGYGGGLSRKEWLLKHEGAIGGRLI